MNETPQPLRVYDPTAGRWWEVPAVPITRLDADVAERWFINVAVPAELFPDLVPLPFLTPDLRDGKVVVSLCRIRMRHAAPAWAPLAMGPASDNAALRVGCLDSRDGSPAVWVDQRMTTHILGRILHTLGFPPVEVGLRVTTGIANDRFRLEGPDQRITCTVCPRQGQAPPRLFSSGDDLTTWVTAGVRSYAATTDPLRFRVVDLEKGSPNAFQILDGWAGDLHTPWGTWPTDGVYRTVDGHYQWRVLQFVDRNGDLL